MADMVDKRLYNAIQDKSDPTIIEQLIKKNVDCNLSYFHPNKNTFISPIHLAIKTNRGSTLRSLYEDRNRPTKAHLKKYFAFYNHHTNQLRQRENEIVLDYIISRLLYTRLNQQSRIKIETLIVALRNYNGVTLDGQNLNDGSQPEIYLQLRIYTLFRWILNEMKISPDDFKINILVDELLHNLETYYFLKSIDFIPIQITDEMLTKTFTEIKRSNTLLIKYYQYIALNLIKKIEQLQIDQEYTIPTGWQGHAVCVSFRRVSQTHISIRIDNSSPSNPSGKHEIVRAPNGSKEIRPKILGRLHIDNIPNNLDYFVLLIDSVARDLSAEEGVALIYNHENKILHLDTNQIQDVPSFPIQADANCFVKCFEAGIRLRFGNLHPELYRNFLLEEKYTADMLKSRCETECESDRNNIFSWFRRLAIDNSAYNLPITQRMHLQNQLKMSYRRNYKYMLTFTEGQSRSSVTEKYVPLKFKKDKTDVELQNIFGEPRVLLIADAGCGKTTICRYMAYSWAKEEIWQNRYEWLFYIKIRNLNSTYYPPPPNAYSLVDIVKKECFRGVQLGDSEIQNLRQCLENSKYILWILDGCDERVVPTYLTSIEEQLFEQPNLLLTARPYVSDDLQYDVQINLQPFNENDIENYISKYFSPMFRTTAKECWSIIKYSDQLKTIAQVPACLQIICRLFESNKNLIGLGMSMGELYQKMCEYLLRRYLLKFHNERTGTIAGQYLYRLPNALAFTYLESIAFQVTKRHQLIISGEELPNIDRSGFLSVLQIGLLVSDNQTPSSVPAENTYYFVHRSLQEYLCARFMIKALSSNYSEEDKNEVIQFICDEKYNRDLQLTFRFFFDLKPSAKCSDQFWLAVGSEPRDLVGIRHCSRIIKWFQDGTCGSSDGEKVENMTIDVVKKWISDQKRQAHDYSNKYLFESFRGAINDELWLQAWKEDLFINKKSRRRYFLPDVWSAKNIKVFRKVYARISENQVEKLFYVIRNGPTERNLARLNLDLSLFSLYTVRCKMIRTNASLIEVQRKVRERQPITTLEEFRSVLRNYEAFAKLNRQTAALGKEIWELKIDPSALENIDNKTLKHLLDLTENTTLFYRYFELPIVPFLQLYAQQTDPDDDTLVKLIVSITFSTICLVTASSDPVKCVRVHQIRRNDQWINLKLNEQKWKRLTDAFAIARDSYGYSCFYQNVD